MTPEEAWKYVADNRLMVHYCGSEYGWGVQSPSAGEWMFVAHRLGPIEAVAAFRSAVELNERFRLGVR